MTQLINARKNIITQEMLEASQYEHVPAEKILALIKEGKVIIPKNKLRKNVRSLAIGESMLTKINLNLGTSQDCNNLETELEKLRVGIEAGADAAMDLSTGGDIAHIRKTIVEHCSVPVGTVPVYQNIVKLRRDGKEISDLSEKEILENIEQNGKDGVDFITIHCSLTTSAIKKMENTKRITGVVSRGGSILTAYIKKTGKENPYYLAYDKILEIAKEYDIALSLGDGLRPGCINDATDSLQIDELMVSGELQQRAFEAGVQVMIEGPGHVPMSEIKMNMQLEKKICNNAPFYVLGPLVTDVAPGYDHIVSAIGGAIAAANGADFLCYVTPSEHLRLPTVDDVRMGVIASKIAAHVGDLEKKRPDAWKWDKDMAEARASLNWERMLELALDPKRAREYRESSMPKESANDVCTMCGDLCAMKKM